MYTIDSSLKTKKIYIVKYNKFHIHNNDDNDPRFHEPVFHMYTHLHNIILQISHFKNLNDSYNILLVIIKGSYF